MTHNMFKTAIAVILLCASAPVLSQSNCIISEKNISLDAGAETIIQGNFNGSPANEIVIVFPNEVKLYNNIYPKLDFAESIQHSSIFDVNSPGDIQHDGYDDLIITVKDSLIVYLGSAAGLFKDLNLSKPLASILQNTNSYNGITTVFLDDTDNDSIPEIMVTAGFQNNKDGFAVIEYESGEWKVKQHFDSQDYNVGYSNNLKNLGDINNDGFRDIGSYQAPAGFIFIFYGSTNGINITNSVMFYGPENMNSLEVVGDVNNDGYPDILASAPQYDINDEAAVLFLGKSGYTLDRAWSTYLDSYRESEYLGFGSVSGGLGDINNDGFDDFYVGGNSAYFGKIFLGKSDVSNIVFSGRMLSDVQHLQLFEDFDGDHIADYISLSGPISNNLVLFKGNGKAVQTSSCLNKDEPYLTFGFKYAKGAGDVNGDGYGDIVMGHDDLDPSGVDEIGNVSVATGAFTGTSNQGMSYGVFQEFFGDQFATGDFNNDGYTDVAAGLYGRGQVLLFFGKTPAMTNKVDTIMQYNFGMGWGEYIEGVGDVNGDGFDDFLAYLDGTRVVYGAKGLPVVGMSWSANGYEKFRAGDVNGDGFSDFYVLIEGGYQLYFGSANLPVTATFISPNPVVYGGDINNDGFDDALQTDKTSNTVKILYGSPSGLIPTNQQIENVFAPSGIGDFNGDGFDDVAVSNKWDNQVIPGLPDRVDVYLGSASGIQSSIYKTFRGFERNQSLRAQQRGVDFNKDGSEELLISTGSEIWMFKGITGTGELKCPSDTILYSDSTCTALITGIPLVLDNSRYFYQVTGATNLEGIGPINGLRLRTGKNFIILTHKDYPEASCRFTISILDTIAPKLLVSKEQIICSSNFQAKAPTLSIQQTCDIEQISYVLEGATTGSGNGTVAGTQYNPGITIITWTVNDFSGNTSKISTSVTILEDLGIKIFPAYQVNKQQSGPNTIFTGYGNNTIRISVWQANSTNFKYLWSTGDTTRYLRIKQGIPGTYKYSVKVTNENGCEDTTSTIIKVVDNYCPNPIKDFIMSNWTDQLNNPWIMTLLNNVSESYICKDGVTDCVPTLNLSQYIAQGAVLGKCMINKNTLNDRNLLKEFQRNEIGVVASPNPSTNHFNVQIQGIGNSSYTVRVYNNLGKIIYQRTNQTGNMLMLGNEWKSGVYFCEIITSTTRKTIKLIKTR